jgi:hypothetical protein
MNPSATVAAKADAVCPDGKLVNAFVQDIR